MGIVTERLVAFLYDLLRDDLPAGAVERLVREGEKYPPPYKFSNSHLEAYARELAQRLLPNLVAVPDAASVEEKS